MPWFSADLHLHSCLSPCGSLKSSPTVIASNAKKQNLDLIALTDHNSTLNCPAFAESCRRVGIAAIFGMEATTSEEAHCLCIFPTLDSAMDFGLIITKKLLIVPNDPEQWGDQVYVNADDEIEGEVDMLLVSATSLSLDELGDLVHFHGGLFIPAHVDRNAFSLMSQLGFVPPGKYDALEIYRESTNHHTLRFKPQTIKKDAVDWHTYCLPPESGQANDQNILLPVLICDSDAHFPEDVGKHHFRFWSESPVADFSGLKMALHRGWINRNFNSNLLKL